MTGYVSIVNTLDAGGGKRVMRDVASLEEAQTVRKKIFITFLCINMV
jgi:hypothetical protein